MKIKESIIFLDKYKKENPENKKVSTIVNDYVAILAFLSKKEPSRLLGLKLILIILNNIDSIKMLKSNYNEFLSFVKKEFGIVPKGHYTMICLTISSLIGSFILSIHIIFFDYILFVRLLPMILIIIGLTIGLWMDDYSKKQNLT